MKPNYTACCHPAGCSRPAQVSVRYMETQPNGSVEPRAVTFCKLHLDDAHGAINELKLMLSPPTQRIMEG